MRKYLLPLLFFVSIGFLFGQELPVSFQRYYSKDGLSSNTIYSIYRDSYGFLWLGTEDGLNRYDGRTYKVYRHDTNNELGLRANHINSLCEDEEGRVWIGTTGGGLSYYDRKLDKIIAYEKTPDNRLLSPAITSLGKDFKGNLWVSSYGDLSIINTKNINSLPDKSYAKVINFFLAKFTRFIYRDRNNQMWVSTNGFIYKISSDFSEIIEYKIPSTGGITIEISSITEDKQGKIWAGSSHGLFFIDKYNTKFKALEEVSNIQLSSKRVYALGQDNKGGVWIGTDNGLDVLNTERFAIERFKPDVSNIHSLSHKSIRSIFVDQFGIYWVGTYQGGLNKYDTNLSQFGLKGINVWDRRSESTSMITSFLEYNNNVLVGVDGGGLYLYNRANDKIQVLDEFKSIKNLTVLTLQGNQDEVYIGTYQQGVIRYNFNSKIFKHYKAGNSIEELNHNEVFCLTKDSKGNLWIGTNGGGINILDAKTGTVRKYLAEEKSDNANIRPPSNFIRSLKQDNEGRMWIGTYGAGVSIYDPKSNQTVLYNRENSGLPSNYILSIHHDMNGTTWVGTNGNGVGVLTKGDSKFSVLTEQDGLINGVIQSIVEAYPGKIWFSTNRGLSCYNTTKKVFKNYTQAAGLQQGSFMLGAGLKMSDGEMFFGGQNGFNHFYPNNLKINKNPARVVLTDLKIDNQLVFPSEDGPIQSTLQTSDIIKLDFKQNFSISFAALNFTVPEENHYEYRLVGFDKNWISVDNDLSAYYTNLDPGDYVFEVRGSNNDGIWDDTITHIKIEVAPPFWRTIYAYIFYLIVIAGTLLFIRHRGIKNLKQKFAIEQERINASQLIEQQKREGEALHKLDQMKIKFLTNLSHEFRTPISLIVGPIDNLIHQIQDANARNQLDLIKRNAKRLLNLVNQLLDFRKMEEHELKLQNSDGDLVAYVQEVFQSFNDMAIQRDVDYSFYSSQEKLYASFDENKIERIFFNLISNAFKFTEKGGDIAIRISAVDYQENNKVKVSFEVRDTGIGIPKEVQEAIFDSFFQHDTAGKVLNQGSGIGLSIAESFVNMYGGKIKVDSELGKGSVFYFDLLLDSLERTIVDSMNVSIAEEPELDPNLRNKPSLLIVEDDDDFRDYLKEILNDSYKVLEANNGKEGWQKALFHHPDIVLCDVQMPLMNGMELANKMAQDKRTKHIPIVLMTASQVENGLICGLESGAVDYITKPFDIGVLLAKVNSLLILHQAFKDVYSKQVSIAVPEIAIVSEKDKFLKNVLNYVYENIDNPQLSVEALSSHLFMSRASLYNRLLEYTGMSPVDFIRSVKLEKAANLLEKSDKTISEIAYETGFANPNYFTKVFKVKYQMTPSEYIHAMKKDKV
ncbi:hybrid sensor histidine kinase/response regulator transcription factor [Sphingobacterium bovistauri]|uniref:histidine kinase n=1 Tax=Sphingobacterium bovistauri TaxID=2781959 RepID=A0ABS7Z382_9SPHI|nr:hybrid sensor histidine kinase/response regulator transcription factor [Sphingobacterium bovistauri]MCA5004624.1 response regulator [Sphingobacterium bovistauri]